MGVNVPIPMDSDSASHVPLQSSVLQSTPRNNELRSISHSSVPYVARHRPLSFRPSVCPSVCLSVDGHTTSLSALYLQGHSKVKTTTSAIYVGLHRKCILLLQSCDESPASYMHVPLSFPTGLILRTLGLFIVFILLNGCVRLSRL